MVPAPRRIPVAPGRRRQRRGDGARAGPGAAERGGDPLGGGRLRPLRGRRAPGRPHRARVGAAQGRRLPATASSGSGCTTRAPGSSRRSAEHFELHPLAVEDAVHAHQRAKLEVYGGTRCSSSSRPPATSTARSSSRSARSWSSSASASWSPSATARAARCTTSASTSRPIPTCSGIGPSSVLYAIADRIVDDYAGGHRRHRRRHRGGRGRGLLRRELQPGRAHLPPQARGARVPPRRHAAASAPMQRLASKQAGPAARPAHGGVLPRRPRPPGARRRAHRGLRRAADQRAAGQPRPDHDARQPGHAPDLGLGGDHRRADDGLRPLRHELRAHARAESGPTAIRWSSPWSWPSARSSTASSSTPVGSERSSGARSRTSTRSSRCGSASTTSTPPRCPSSRRT